MSPTSNSSRYDFVEFHFVGASEGTSLSCLEAMACGKAVVAGAVGGLTDLVIDRFNGRLIPITPANLIAAVEELIRDPGERRRLGERARETAAAFSIDRWKECWARALKRAWGEADPALS